MGFLRVKKPAKGIGGFDTDYIDRQIVDVVVKTGEGESDFSIQKKVVETKRDIQKSIDVDASSVGVYNIINQVMRTGDMSLLPVDKGNEFTDLVDAPNTLMDIKNLGADAEKKFNSLPKELVDGLDMASFVKSMSQEKFDSFMKAMADRAAAPKESGKEEK